MVQDVPPASLCCSGGGVGYCSVTLNWEARQRGSAQFTMRSDLPQPRAGAHPAIQH